MLRIVLEEQADQTNMGRGSFLGKLTEAGIYTVSVFAEDCDKLLIIMSGTNLDKKHMLL